MPAGNLAGEKNTNRQFDGLCHYCFLNLFLVLRAHCVLYYIKRERCVCVCVSKIPITAK